MCAPRARSKTAYHRGMSPTAWLLLSTLSFLMLIAIFLWPSSGRRATAAEPANPVKPPADALPKIDYEEDVDRALRVLGEVGKALAAARPAAILEPPIAEGILRFGQGSSNEMVLRLHARVVATEKVPLEIEARRRAREAFAAHDIRAPRAALDVRVTPSPGGGSAGDARKESVA